MAPCVNTRMQLGQLQGIWRLSTRGSAIPRFAAAVRKDVGCACPPHVCTARRRRRGMQHPDAICSDRIVAVARLAAVLRANKLRLLLARGGGMDAPSSFPSTRLTEPTQPSHVMPTRRATCGQDAAVQSGQAPGKGWLCSTRSTVCLPTMQLCACRARSDGVVGAECGDACCGHACVTSTLPGCGGLASVMVRDYAGSMPSSGVARYLSAVGTQAAIAFVTRPELRTRRGPELVIVALESEMEAMLSTHSMRACSAVKRGSRIVECAREITCGGEAEGLWLHTLVAALLSEVSARPVAVQIGPAFQDPILRLEQGARIITTLRHPVPGQPAALHGCACSAPSPSPRRLPY